MEDLDLWLRISQKENVAFIDEPLAVYRVHGTSTTASIRVFLSKYLFLLKKWRKEVTVTTMLLRYALLVYHMGVMVLRKIKGAFL